MSGAIQEENLATIRQSIKDAILARIEDAREEGGDLEEVRSVIYGHRTKVHEIKVPAVWVVPAPHDPQTISGHTVDHGFRFDFAALVESYDPADGINDAEDLKARLYDLISDDRNLDGEVYDVAPVRYDPTYQMAAADQLFWSACQFEFRVRRRE